MRPGAEAPPSHALRGRRSIGGTVYPEVPGVPLRLLPQSCVLFNIYQGTVKLKRSHRWEDRVIIRVSLMRHTIFRNLPVRLIKYLYRSLLGTWRAQRQ